MDIWETCVAFHGHACGGLTIGYKAALYAVRLLELEEVHRETRQCCISEQEEIVCIAENDACGVDAIQVILGCSVGKGNLLFHMCGKQAFSFYNRKNEKSVRLVLKPDLKVKTREESLAYYQSREPEELLDVKETVIPLPEKARMFQSVVCSRCGEKTSENYIHMQNGEMLCPDCMHIYDRFRV